LDQDKLGDLLDFFFSKYNTLSFIEDDPISVPHQFVKKQDIEIAGLFAAILAWGLRKTIIAKSRELLDLMGNAPHDFVLNHSDADLKGLRHFKHRTFNYTDLLYFIHFLRKSYSNHDSLEVLFMPEIDADNIGSGIDRFYTSFISDDHFPDRTKKHVASPSKKSACKRVNMYLRWMVRKDESGVDFGIWGNIKTHQLVCPCDVHVEKIARKLGLVQRRQVDWLMAEELTGRLKQFDPIDPVKYDFALFGMGLNKEI
jgi:uncharacterized protein (TIGR02757 family)